MVKKLKKKAKSFKLLTLLYAFSFIITASIVFAGAYDRSVMRSDSYSKHAAIALTGIFGSCSGVQIAAPSGRSYILSAAHCAVLADDEGRIMTKTEDNVIMRRRILSVSVGKDLMLLEAVPGLEGLHVARHYSANMHVRTFTHGRGFPTYKTEGYIIGTMWIDTENLHLREAATTAKVVPGSSGGMAVNDAGEIVGIVSAGSIEFGFFVVLDDIHKFLAKR